MLDFWGVAPFVFTTYIFSKTPSSPSSTCLPRHKVLSTLTLNLLQASRYTAVAWKIFLKGWEVEALIIGKTLGISSIYIGENLSFIGENAGKTLGMGAP